MGMLGCCTVFSQMIGKAVRKALELNTSKGTNFLSSLPIMMDSLID
jgi:hypothetical protein